MTAIVGDLLFPALVGSFVLALLGLLITPRWASVVSSMALWFAVACFVLATSMGAAGGEISVAGGDVGLRFSSFALLWSSTVLLVGAVVMTFAERYLKGNPGLPVIRAAGSGVLLSIVMVVAAVNVATLMVAWWMVGLAYIVAFSYRGRSSSVRTLVQAFVFGDVLVTAGFVLLLIRVGNQPITQLDQHPHLGEWSLPIAMLLAVGMLIRSGQGPFLGWLRVTVDAPTPVSALLHAGVINGGMIVIIRLAPVVLGTAPALWLLAGVGGLTAVFAVVSARYRGDYKGRLVLSTSAQMGFVLVEIAVGAFALALVHLCLHAAYKAWLFLSSSSQIATTLPPSRPRLSTPSRPRALSVLGVVTVAVLGALAMVVLEGNPVSMLAVVLGSFAFVTALTYLWRLRAGRAGWYRLLQADVGVVFAFGILGLLVHLVTNDTSTSLSTAGIPSLAPWWLLVVGIAVILVGSMAKRPRVGRALASLTDGVGQIRGYRYRDVATLAPISIEPDELKLAG
ncbi:MAG: proton-conducting transporter membrane subunit [Ferrimicrobium sp.]